MLSSVDSQRRFISAVYYCFIQEFDLLHQQKVVSLSCESFSKRENCEKWIKHQTVQIFKSYDDGFATNFEENNPKNCLKKLPHFS